MKVYIGKVPREMVVDAERNIIHAGIRALDGVEKVRTEEEADIIIYSQRYADHHCGIAFWQERYASTRKFLSPLEIKYPEKTVIMDYADDPLSLIPLSQPVKAYYKRSLIAKSKSNEIESKIVKKIKEDKSEAWKEYQKPIFKVRDDLNSFLEVLMGKSNIIKSLSHEKGIFYRIKLPAFIFEKLGVRDFILSRILFISSSISNFSSIVIFVNNLCFNVSFFFFNLGITSS